MAKFLLILFLGFTTYVSAQVGINTLEPQQKLHVAGATENVRVEGLNKPNNTNNLGAESTTRVFVDANGDLVLGTMSQQPFEILVDAENYLQNGENTGNEGNQINQTGTGEGYSQAGMPIDLASAVFTLTKPAIIEVHYSMSWSAQKNANNRIMDNRARIFQTGLYFRTGTKSNLIANPYSGTPVGSGYIIGNQERADLIALNGQFYTNGDSNRGVYQKLQNTGTDYVKLPAGTYVALYVGRLAVGDTGGVGAIKAYLGEGVEDNLQIIAYYYE